MATDRQPARSLYVYEFVFLFFSFSVFLFFFFLIYISHFLILFLFRPVELIRRIGTPFTNRRTDRFQWRDYSAHKEMLIGYKVTLKKGRRKKRREPE